MENNQPSINLEFIERIREDERSKKELHRELDRAYELGDALEYASLCIQLDVKRPRDMVLYQEGVKIINQTPHFSCRVQSRIC